METNYLETDYYQQDNLCGLSTRPHLASGKRGANAPYSLHGIDPPRTPPHDVLGEKYT